MEDFVKIDVTPKEGVNGRQPRGISISKIKPGNFYDAIGAQENDPNHHLPSIEELHIIGQYAPFMLPIEYALWTTNQIENLKVLCLFFTHPEKDKYESKEIQLERTKSAYYILVRLEY